jgi:hypothetical protein
MTTSARHGRLASRRSRPPAAAVPPLVVALALGLGACSSTDDSEPAKPAATSPAAATPPLPTTVKVGVVTGRVGRQEEERAVRNVTRAVDGWFDAAYVGGDYPRETFADAFPRFTKGAADEAGRDVMLMTNAELGQRIDGVTPKIRRLTVDLLGVRGVAQAATARVRLVFVTEGGVQRRVTVAGRLRLVRQNRVWRVFGYDITKAEVPAGATAAGENR